MSKGISHPADSHLFVYAYNITPNDDPSQPPTPVYRCAHCKRYAIQNVHDAALRAHACVYRCQTCTDSAVYISAEMLLWHARVAHRVPPTTFLTELSAVEARVMAEKKKREEEEEKQKAIAAAASAAVASAIVPAAVSRPAKNAGKSIHHLITAVRVVNDQLSKVGIYNRGSLSGQCDMNCLYVTTMNDAVRIPAAMFIAIAAAISTAAEDASISHDEQWNVKLEALIPAVLPSKASLLAEHLDLATLRRKARAAVQIYKETPWLSETALTRYAVSAVNQILPASSHVAVPKSPRGMKRARDTTNGETTIESTSTSPAAAKRPKLDT
jgi:hypothetical protein